jgi:glycosyltransferase involved in cell wall biosynthesis
MDQTGEMILAHLASGHSTEVSASRFCPPFRHRAARLPANGRRGAALNVDRLINRFADYPRALGRAARRGEYDLFHIVDHSYSQLVHALPPGRSVVTCHDLDTFRCLLEPEHDPRPAWFRFMARRILSGLSKAAAVACVSRATGDELLKHRVVAPDRVHIVPNGIAPEFTPGPDFQADAEASRLLGPLGPCPSASLDILHVGTTIPRKRVDVLLSVFATVRRAVPGVRLIKAGGTFTPDQERQARDLGVADAVVTLPFLPRPVLAAVYRRAALVIQPTQAEGFGLPLAEALACGAPLLASDLPVLHEVAGDAAVYRPVGDIPAWTQAALSLLDERAHSPDSWQARRDAGIARAQIYSWQAHADRLTSIYRSLLPS